MNTRRCVVGAVAVAAVAARLPALFTQSLSQDEVASARIIGEQTFPHLLVHVARTESTPPLWYTLAWVTHRSGVPIQDVRLLSVAAGATPPPLVGGMGGRVPGRAVAAPPG